MSCDADAKPVITKRIRVQVKGDAAGSVKARSATAVAMASCIDTIHQRLLFRISTKGLQRGLISQGRPIRLVRSARRLFSIPRSLRITTDMVFTIKYGRPSAKYRVGTQSQGLRCFIRWCRDSRRKGFRDRSCRKPPSRPRLSGKALRHGPSRGRGG